MSRIQRPEHRLPACETDGLPDPGVPRVPSRADWPSAFKSLAASLAIALGAFFTFGKRREAVTRSEATGEA